MANSAPSDSSLINNERTKATTTQCENVPAEQSSVQVNAESDSLPGVRDFAIVALVAGTPLAALLERLRTVLNTYMATEDIALIYDALAFAHQHIVSVDQLRPLFDTGIILAEMHIDATGIATGMLQHITIDPASSVIIPVINAAIMETFGPDVAYLMEEIAHFGAI